MDWHYCVDEHDILLRCRECHLPLVYQESGGGRILDTIYRINATVSYLCGNCDRKRVRQDIARSKSQ
jgi:hypothetical protein